MFVFRIHWRALSEAWSASSEAWSFARLLLVDASHNILAAPRQLMNLQYLRVKCLNLLSWTCVVWQNCWLYPYPPNLLPAISWRHSIPYTFYQCLSYTMDALMYVQSLWCKKCWPLFPTQGIRKRGVNLPPKFAITITISRLLPQDTLFLIPFTSVYPTLRTP